MHIRTVFFKKNIEGMSQGSPCDIPSIFFKQK